MTNKQSSVKGGLFWYSILTIVLTYLFLKIGVPYISMYLTGKPNPLPIPGAGMILYMTLTIVGTLIYVTTSQGKIDSFLAPPIRMLKAETRGYKIIRGIIFLLFPLLVGVITFKQGVKSIAAPSGLRIQHPTLPGKYEKMTNPFRNPDEEALRKFISEKGLGNIGLTEAKGLFIAEAMKEGRALYQTNCQPCHGCAADGEGPMGKHLLLRPANFRIPDTITTVIESYNLWRIKEGGIGLPRESSPWDSAMPSWKKELTEEQIWKIILAEYDTADTEPRILEKVKH